MISIVICTYNRSEILKKCIDSILKNRSKEKFEILVVDNNSKDNTESSVKEYMKKYKNIRYVKELNEGLSHARNRGIAEAKFEYLVFVDDDVVLNENYIYVLSNFIKNNKNVVCIAGKVIPVWNISKPKWFSDEFFSIVGETRYGVIIRKLKSREYPVGCNMIFRKNIFNDIGFFDTGLGIKGEQLCLGEENDICDKIRCIGYKIFYLPEAYVYHKVHENKVNKVYIENRLALEGSSIAKCHINTKDRKGLIYNCIKRYVIIILRDYPALAITTLFNKNKVFEKECKLIRSKQYIGEIRKFLNYNTK